MNRPYRGLTAEALTAILGDLSPDDLIVPNALANLAIVGPAGDYIGYIDVDAGRLVRFDPVASDEVHKDSED